MKYALIGCGRIATNHVRAAIGNDFQIVGVCDVVPERMEELLSDTGWLRISLSGAIQTTNSCCRKPPLIWSASLRKAAFMPRSR